TAFDARVDAAVRGDGDAFGRVAADLKALGRSEARVRLVDAGERRRGLRLPRRRLNGHGPQQQVEHDERREGQDGEQDFTFHLESAVVEAVGGRRKDSFAEWSGLNASAREG